MPAGGRNAPEAAQMMLHLKISQSINQSSKQAINQAVDQSSNQSTSPSMNPSTDQPKDCKQGSHKYCHWHPAGCHEIKSDSMLSCMRQPSMCFCSDWVGRVVSHRRCMSQELSSVMILNPAVQTWASLRCRDVLLCFMFAVPGKNSRS